MKPSECGTCGAPRPAESSPGRLCPACLLMAAFSDRIAPDVSEDVPVYALPSGTTLGPFRIRRPLGRGGMAAVYEAEDTTLDRAVALKVLPAEFLHDQTFARRFETEARLIAKLEHQNIVPIYASGIDAGIPWMSMRLLTGNNLSAVLEQRRLAPSEVVRLLRQVAAALDYAHGLGVVHRDIKPANILLDAAGTACVADFGLAQLIGAGNRLTQTGMLTGTPHYMAPEQALGKPVDHRCDIYSLGIVAYEMLAGTIPFTAHSPVAVLLKQVHDTLPVPPDGLSPWLWINAVRKAAAKDPNDRWPSAGTFVEELESSIGAANRHTDAKNVSAPPRAFLRSRAVWTAVLGGALLAAVGLAWVVVRKPAVIPPQPPTHTAVERPGEITAPAGAPPIGVPTVSNQAAPDRKQRIATPSANLPPARRSRPDIPSPDPSAPQPTGNAAAAVSPQVPVPRSTLEVAEIPPAADPLTRVPGVAAPPPHAPDVFTHAEIIREVKPTYPPVALAAELEGEVVLEGVVGVDGQVREITVKRSNPLFDDAARKAWRLCHYKPARLNGTPQPQRIEKAFKFVLR